MTWLLLPNPELDKVVLDTNVLFQLALRDVLLKAARMRFFVPYWSQDILDELVRTLSQYRESKRRGAYQIMSHEEAVALCAELNARFPDAMVHEYKPFILQTHNEMDDRHVAAVAIKCDASIIVTSNAKDFVGIPKGITAVIPDDFLCTLFDRRSKDFLTILLNQLGAEHKPNTLEGLLTRLSFGKKPNFPGKVLEFLANNSHP
ncbi:MAG: PIN domain-containing protein [Desulfovibrio sp.]|jgi:predicted nucleic acid-binding protein|nr:PIN domain-containing protein [Desulfovibrio sp.]